MRSGKVLTETEWLERRSRGIGASEVPAVLGVNPWQSPYALWAEKTGQILPQDPTRRMIMGHHDEPKVAEFYAEDTGREIEDPGDYTIWIHPDHPWLFCTPDRIVRREDGAFGPLELKTSDMWQRADWESGNPPMAAQVQLQIQIACMGTEWGALAGYIGGESFALDVDRHERLIENMIPRLERFWQCVLDGEPPAIDGSESTARVIRALHPQDNGETVALSQEAIEAARALVDINESLKEVEGQKSQAQNVIKMAIGDATFGEGGGFRFSLKTTTRRGQIVVPEACREQLDAAGISYEVKGASEYRSLRALKVK